MRLARWVALAMLVGFVVFALAWRAEGGRWEVVQTPSMGEVAPVGSLLWTKPVPFDSLRVGDFISFHPPKKDATYSHRVYAVNDDGTITTKGVIPGPDPWQLTAHDVVGKVRMNWWGVGWLVVAGPMFLIGGFVIAVIRTFARQHWKLPITLILGSVLISLALVWYRPLINAQQVAFAPAKGGGADASYVGTGLLPIRLTAHGGPSVVLTDGEVGTVHVSTVDRKGKYKVELSPAVPFWWWVGLVLACFVPALYSLVIGLPPRPLDEPSMAPKRRGRKKRGADRDDSADDPTGTRPG